MTDQNGCAEHWKDADRAFADAILSGRLSDDPSAPNYAGNYMYMGPGTGGDAFKNRLTREYIK